MLQEGILVRQKSTVATVRIEPSQPLAGGSDPFADTRWQAGCLDLERIGYRSGFGSSSGITHTRDTWFKKNQAR